VAVVEVLLALLLVVQAVQAAVVQAAALPIMQLLELQTQAAAAVEENSLRLAAQAAPVS
jgi:hypothetical protein